MTEEDLAMSVRLQVGAVFSLPPGFFLGNAKLRGRTRDGDMEPLAPKIIRLVLGNGRHTVMKRGEKLRGVVGFVPDGLRPGDLLQITWIFRELPGGPRCFRAEPVAALAFDDAAQSFARTTDCQGGWYLD